jgi:phage terminase large subunit
VDIINITKKEERFRKIVGQGYDEFLDFKGRYRVVKGGRASKKSKTAALWYIYNMMQYRKANLLVVRKTYNSLRNSCFSELKWAIEQLKAADDWKTKVSPYEMSYDKGGSIYFKGLDNPMRLTSITADKGCLCWVWVEEAFEIECEEDFDMIDESVRGIVPAGLFKQITLTFNPWSDKHWLKKRFFNTCDDNVLAFSTNYTCNEFLDDSDRALFERMKSDNPKRFKVAGLGEWGVADGLVYENWECAGFDVRQIVRSGQVKTAFGLDFGYTNDPSALCCMLVDPFKRHIYVFDEMYGFGMSNRDIFNEICAMGYRKEKIFADSAEPKSIDELYNLGLSGIRKARKGADSVNHGIQFVQGHKLTVHPKCVNFLKEISVYGWARRISGRVPGFDGGNNGGKMTNVPQGGFDHLMDAMRYGLTEISGGERWGF